MEQELRRLFILCQGEQVARSGEQESIARRSGRCQDDSVDDVWQNRDTSTNNGNDPRRRGGACSAVQESIIVSWNGHTNSQGSEDVEEKNSPEDLLNVSWLRSPSSKIIAYPSHRLRNVSAGVLSLTGGHGDHLNTSVRERSCQREGR